MAKTATAAAHRSAGLNIVVMLKRGGQGCRGFVAVPIERRAD